MNTVYLVGAGPGDPDLLTMRAVRAIAQADLVLYDALVDPEVLAIAPRAMKVSVGKRARRHAMSQEEINALLVRAARRGRRVVRLKGGDPFVFGRGGEEAFALREARIPFEVVPGVSSAIAGPGAIGIPVTHRGLESAFVVVTAEPAVARQKVLNSLAPQSATVVVLMGLGAREPIRDELLTRGWRADTPVAIVLGAHTDRQWSFLGRLDELTIDLPEAVSELPGLIVIGGVVSLAHALAPSFKEILDVHA